jgi:hypothetical protein
MAAIRNTRTGGARKRIAGETAKGATPKKKGSAPKVITSDKLPNGKRNNNYNPHAKPTITADGPTPTKAQRPNTVLVSKAQRPNTVLVSKAQRPNTVPVSKPAVKAPANRPKTK